MARSERDTLKALADRWVIEASGYEKNARDKGEYTPIERRMLDMHARVKRGCAEELKRELEKVRRD